MMFNNNNTGAGTGNNPFNNTNTAATNNLFNNNRGAPTNTNTGTGAGNNLFANNNNTGAGGLNMGNNNTTGMNTGAANNLFTNNSGNNNFFFNRNNNNTAGTGMGAGTGMNTGTGMGMGTGGNNNMFNNMGNNTNTGNMFNNMNTGTGMNTGNNMFSGNNNNNNNMFNRGNTGMGVGNNMMGGTNNMGMGMNYQYNQTMNQYLNFQNNLQTTKAQLQDCLRKMAGKNLQSIRLDSWNIYKDKPLNKLPLKQQTVKILLNFHELKKITQTLKKSNQQIQKKMANHSKQTHKKLALYKKCLLQTISHNKLIQEISSQLDLMNKQIQDYFKPLYNAYKYKKKTSIKQPNQFDLKISYDVLNKLQALNQRVDDMIVCQSSLADEEVENTISVFEQLIQYYQNVSCSFKDFSYRYNKLKRQAIEKQRGKNYQAVMSKVADKVEENLKKEFKYYDLIKEIDELLAEKEKREEKKRIQAHNKFDSFDSRRAMI